MNAASDATTHAVYFKLYSLHSLQMNNSWIINWFLQNYIHEILSASSKIPKKRMSRPKWINMVYFIDWICYYVYFKRFVETNITINFSDIWFFYWNRDRIELLYEIFKWLIEVAKINRAVQISLQNRHLPGNSTQKFGLEKSTWKFDANLKKVREKNRCLFFSPTSLFTQFSFSTDEIQSVCVCVCHIIIIVRNKCEANKISIGIVRNIRY